MNQTIASPSREIPRIPATSLLLGNLREFIADPTGFLLELGNEYDEIVESRMLMYRSSMLVHPQAIEHVLHRNHTNYDKNVFDYRMLKLRLLGNGLLTNDGADWLRQRRLSQPAFHRKRMAGYGLAMRDCTRLLVQRWEREAVGEVLDIGEEMAALTLQIVGRALFSRDLTGDADEIGAALAEANHLMTERLLSGLPPWVNFTPRDFKLKKAARRLWAVVDAMIAERMADASSAASIKDAGDADAPADLLSMLMSARDESGQAMSPRQLRDEILTLLLAGHETTATALTWTFHLLAQNPEALQHLEQEVDVSVRDGAPAFDDLAKLPYTRMALEESMRLYPPAWSIARRAIQADTIMGYRIPAGAVLYMNPLVTHRHRSFWDEPLAFRPERFSPENRKSQMPYAYFPFGGGPRLCIGADFALAEMTMILAGIVSRFRLRSTRAEVKMQGLITLRPVDGMPMRIELRT
ncbi:MAG: cytochrome P450 [bacterium]|nr:cytochrome P450 [bacterium]